MSGTLSKELQLISKQAMEARRGAEATECERVELEDRLREAAAEGAGQRVSAAWTELLIRMSRWEG